MEEWGGKYMQLLCCSFEFLFTPSDSFFLLLLLSHSGSLMNISWMERSQLSRINSQQQPSQEAAAIKVT